MLARFLHFKQACNEVVCGMYVYEIIDRQLY